MFLVPLQHTFISSPIKQETLSPGQAVWRALDLFVIVTVLFFYIWFYKEFSPVVSQVKFE